MLWWKCGNFQISSDQTYVQQSLSSKINRNWVKSKFFVTREIQYFELGIFSFGSYVYYLTRDFIGSARAFSLLICAFNLPTLATCTFSHLTHELELGTCGFELVTCGFEHETCISELVTRRFQLVIYRFELRTRISEIVTSNL